MKKNKLKAKLFAIIFSAALLLSFVSLNTLAASKDNCATDTQICVEQAENADTKIGRAHVWNSSHTQKSRMPSSA